MSNMILHCNDMLHYLMENELKLSSEETISALAIEKEKMKRKINVMKKKEKLKKFLCL